MTLFRPRKTFSVSSRKSIKLRLRWRILVSMISFWNVCCFALVCLEFLPHCNVRISMQQISIFSLWFAALKYFGPKIWKSRLVDKTRARPNDKKLKMVMYCTILWLERNYCLINLKHQNGDRNLTHEYGWYDIRL